MAESLGILINTGFNLDINKLKDDLGTLQKDTKLNLDLQFDTKQLDSFKSKIDSVGKSLNNNYWQGRFTESIKDMTAIDSELVKMKQFYQEQEKVASATEKRIQKENQINKKLEEELANYRKYAKLQTENIGNRYKNVNGVSENLNAYNKELSEIIVKNGKLVNSNTGVETSFKNLRQDLSNIRVEARNSQNVFTDFKDNIEKFGNWLLVGGFTTGLVSGIKEAIAEINSLSDAITDLRRVSEASDSQLAVLDDQAFKIADKIGGSAEGIVNSMANFSQLGYEYSEAMNLAQDASKYATAGFISNEEATKSLISTYQVFGNTFDEVMGKMVDSKSIIDAFNSVGNKLSITSGQIGEALQQSASSLAVANNSLSESIAMIASAQKIVNDSSKVGNALKTASLRIRGVNESDTDDGTFEAKLGDMIEEITGKYGEAVKIFDEGKQQFLSTYEILKQIGQVFDKMTGAEQTKILEALGGKQNANVIASILKNTEDLEKTFEVIRNSAGSVDEELAISMDTVETKTKQVKNAFLELSSNLYNSDMTKTVLDMTKNMLNFLSSAKSAIPIVTTLLGLFTTMNNQKVGTMFANLGKSIVSSMDTIKILSTEFTKAKQSGLSLGQSLKQVSNYASGTQVSMSSLTSTIGLLVTAISLAYMGWKDYQRKQEEIKQQALDNAKAYKEEINNIEGLKNKYSEIDSSTMSWSEKKEQLRQLQLELLDTYGAEASKLDLVNGKYEEQIKVLNDLKNNKYDTSERVLKNDYNEKQGNLDDLTSNKNFTLWQDQYVNSVQQAMDKVNEIIGKGTMQLKDGNVLSFGNVEDVEEYKRALDTFLSYMDSFDAQSSKTYQDIQNRLTAITEAQGNFTESQKAYFDVLFSNDSQSIVDSLGITDLSKITQEESEKIKESFENMFPEADEDYEKYFDAMIDAMVKVEEQANATGDSLSKYDAFDFISSTFNTAVQSADVLATAMDQLSSSGTLQEEVINDLAKAYPNLLDGVNDVSDIMENIKLEQLNNEVDTTIDEIQSLNSNIIALSEGQTLNANTIQGLIDKYPELADGITETNGVYTVSEEILTDVVDGLYTKTQATINDEIQTTQAVKEGVMAKIQAYSQELSAIKTIAEARGALYEMQQKNLADSKKIDAEFESLQSDPLHTLKSPVTMGLEQTEEQAKAYHFLEDQISQYDEASSKLDKLEGQLNKLNMGTSLANAKASGGNGKPKSSSSKENKEDISDQLKAIQQRGKLLDEQIKMIENQRDIAEELGQMDKVSDYTKQLSDLHNERKIVMHDENVAYEQLKAKCKEEENIIKLEELMATNSQEWYSEKKAQLEEEIKLIDYRYKTELDNISDLQESLENLYTDIKVNPDEYIDIEEQKLDLLKQQQDIAKSKMKDYLDLGLSEQTDEVRELKNELNSLNKQIIEQSLNNIELKINIKELVFEDSDDLKTLIESYIDQYTYLEDMEKVNDLRSQSVEITLDEIDKNRDLISELKRLQAQEKQGSAEYIKYKEEIQEALERENSLISELMNSYKELASARAESDVYGSGGKDAWEKAQDKKIKSYQEQLDALKDQTDEKDKQADLEEKLLEIEQLREKLAWLKTQRTVQALRQDENGNYQWQYEVNQKSIDETQKELDSKLKDYDDARKEYEKDSEEARLQAIIDSLEDEKDMKQEAYEEAQDNYTEFYQSQLATTINGLNDIDRQTDIGLNNVNRTAKDTLSKIKNTFSDKMEGIYKETKKYVAMISEELASVGLSEVPSDITSSSTGSSNNNSSSSISYDSKLGAIYPLPIQSKAYDSMLNSISTSKYSASNISSLAKQTTTSDIYNSYSIANVTLPNVTNPSDFYKGLMAYTGR